MKSTTIVFKNPKLRKAFDEPNEWVGLYNKKQTHIGADKVYIRFSYNGKSSIQLSISLGSELHQLLEWKHGDKILIQRSNIRTHLLKLTKTTDTDVNGYKLGMSSSAPNRIHLKIRAADYEDNSFEIGRTVEAEYDIGDQCLIVDMTELMK